MTTGAMVAHWELTLRHINPHQELLGQYASASTGCSRLAGRAPEEVSLAGEFLLVDVRCASPWADVADILVAPTPPRSYGHGPPGQWLADVLAGHPGAAVAVTGGLNWCTAMTRDGAVIGQVQADSPAGPEPARPVNTLSTAVGLALYPHLALPGCLIHALLVAGWPPSPLSWTQPQQAPSGLLGTWTNSGQAAGDAPFSFGLELADLATGCSPSRRARTWVASGASMAR